MRSCVAHSETIVKSEQTLSSPSITVWTSHNLGRRLKDRARFQWCLTATVCRARKARQGVCCVGSPGLTRARGSCRAMKAVAVCWTNREGGTRAEVVVAHPSLRVFVRGAHSSCVLSAFTRCAKSAIATRGQSDCCARSCRRGGRCA